jgi:hypothetical protein
LAFCCFFAFIDGIYSLDVIADRHHDMNEKGDPN